MFYSTQILAKKGPLGIVWIAAHMDRQLKRHQIYEANITITVDTIMNPEAPLALRLSGQLLLGVVRIFDRQVRYLQQDCEAALVKIRVAVKPMVNSKVDLPPDAAVANLEAITQQVSGMSWCRPWKPDGLHILPNQSCMHGQGTLCLRSDVCVACKRSLHMLPAACTAHTSMHQPAVC